MRKILSAFLAIVLVVTLVPLGQLKQASAASNATYFIPDNTTLRSTSLLTIDRPASDTSVPHLTRANAYVTSNDELTIQGAFSNIQADTMSVRIDLLNLNSSDGTWSPDPARFTTGVVQADNGSTNRFTASNLALFGGMNRITFTALQGSMQRSDVFYVLYDQVPYLQSLTAHAGATQLDINEGVQAVVSVGTVMLQGVAKNANKVTLSVNGGSPLLASVLEDGTFFSPGLSLNPGLNTLDMSITNGSNTINIKRELYYFDPLQPFTEVWVLSGGNYEPYKVSGGNVPSITDGANAVGVDAGLVVRMLVPANASNASFDGTATYEINDSGTSSTVAFQATAGDSETDIPGPDGNPLYKLVRFTLPEGAFTLTSANGTSSDKVQNVKLEVTYGTFNAIFRGKFNYLPGEKIISNMWYLPDFKESAPGDIADLAKEPLKGAEVTDSTFYVMVESPSALTASDVLAGSYLPISTNSLTIANNVAQPANISTTQRVYRISNFLNGQQSVQFKLNSSSAVYKAQIAYVQKSYIYLANLYDGQSLEFDSRQNNEITISGQYMGFSNLSGAQFFINGEEIKTGPFDSTQSNYLSNLMTSPFNLTLDVGLSGPLVFGENRLIFKGVNTVAATGVSQEVVKEVKIYLIDTNVPKIDRFLPVLPGGPDFDEADVSDYSESELAAIFAPSVKFTPTGANQLTTGDQSYDLVIRGYGASFLKLKQGSDVLLDLPISSVSTLVTNGTFMDPTTGETRAYQFSGDQEQFILRLESMPHTAPGSLVYTLELINNSGAASSQTLDIVREVSAFRILAPAATVGDQIVVNKNFVHFDIEAEGATDVLIDGVGATKRTDLTDRFTYDYVGLKADKATDIDIEIIRGGSTTQTTVTVFYASTVQVYSEFMKEMSTKFDVFNKQLSLTFPKGTVLKTANPNLNADKITKLYPDTQILFGIADPETGVVERKNDYGQIIGTNDTDSRTDRGAIQIALNDFDRVKYQNNENTSNFTLVSPVYWISGGAGELKNIDDPGYKPATNGLPPHSIESAMVEGAPGNVAQGDFTHFEPERKIVPTNRGELTLTYNASVVDDVDYMITVFRYTDQGKWENIGGEVDTKKHTITVPFDDFGYYKVMKMSRGFVDVTGHTWARNILNGLYAKGIMKNARTGEFGANDTTSRGEFATLLVKGLNLPLNYDEDNVTFFDTAGASTTTWDYRYIETAARAGIVTGLEEGFFGPSLPITRQDAAVMIARALKLKMSANDSKLEASLAKSFVDSGTIQYYARPAVEAVNKAKIMTGSAGSQAGEKKPLYSFNPKANMTRAEAGKIAVELLKKSTDIFPKTLS